MIIEYYYRYIVVTRHSNNIKFTNKISQKMLSHQNVQIKILNRVMENQKYIIVTFTNK